MDDLTSLMFKVVDVDNNNYSDPDNARGWEALDLIDPQIYLTGWGHSGICPCRTCGVFNWGLTFKEIGSKPLSTLLYTSLFCSLYPLK